MKCLDCNYLGFEAIENGCGVSAKCHLTSSRGKTITWAMTTISEKGKDRVFKSLKSKENAPFWCPIRKKEEDKNEKIN